MELVLRTKHLPQALASHGTVHISGREVAQRIGQVFLQRSAVNLLSSVLDTPGMWLPAAGINPANTACSSAPPPSHNPRPAHHHPPAFTSCCHPPHPCTPPPQCWEYPCLLPSPPLKLTLCCNSVPLSACRVLLVSTRSAAGAV